LGVALHPNTRAETCADVLDKLANDDDVYVLREVALHPRTRASARADALDKLAELAGDENQDEETRLVAADGLRTNPGS
jgi:hypothetical protein